MNKLFPRDLTPQRQHLLRTTWRDIEKGVLRTSDLQICLLHFPQCGFKDIWFFESGSSIAHTRRNQGVLWSKALDVLTTHLYYQELDPEKTKIDILPLNIFQTIKLLLKEGEERQVANELSDIYPHGISKTELIFTLDHMYSKGKISSKRREDESFVFLVSQGNATEDLRLMKRLILYCEEMALGIPSIPIGDLANAVDDAFRTLEISTRPLTADESAYLQLHLLVCFHNVLFDVQSQILETIAGTKRPHQAMLAVNSMGDMLSLDIAYYYLEENKHLEQGDINRTGRFPLYSYPLVSTELDESIYLLETDQNIRVFLHNHPLEVRYRGRFPVLVALDRKNSRFKITRSRQK
jgi:hypothetical protein